MMASLSISSGVVNFKAADLCSVKSALYHRATSLTFQRKPMQQRANPQLSVRANYNGRSSGGGGDFVAGFLLGSALGGALAYIYAPQIRSLLLNEDENGFRRPKQAVYQDDNLESARQTLNAKINQLNSAIDNVASRLKGDNNNNNTPLETDPEEATF